MSVDCLDLTGVESLEYVTFSSKIIIVIVIIVIIAVIKSIAARD